MKHCFHLATTLILVGTHLLYAGPEPATPPIHRGPGPLLYVKLTGPEGSRVTFYQGNVGRDFALPVTVGMRPGYIYRVKLTGFGGGGALYPTLEVRNVLSLPPTMAVSKYPAPVNLTSEQLEHIAAGAFLTKVIYLENPDTATPIASEKDQPLETPASGKCDPVEEARLLGRPVMVVRIGTKQPDLQELRYGSPSGTILYPDEKSLGLPSHPPQFGYQCFMPYDPILGPKPPEEECLKDGGDFGPPAGFDNEGKLRGVNPSDSVAEYKDQNGTKRLTHSNRVCICSPRFGVINTECRLEGNSSLQALHGATLIKGQQWLAAKVPQEVTKQKEKLAGMKARRSLSANLASQGLVKLTHIYSLKSIYIPIGPYAFVGTAKAQELDKDSWTRIRQGVEFARSITKNYGTGVDFKVEQTAVVGMEEGILQMAAVAEPREISCPCLNERELPAKPLFLCKWADKSAAEIGDVVTFTLKYSNIGGKPISEVAVTDSLTGRLEYVEGSAESSRDAVFTLEKNEAGSMILRWEVAGKLLPGQSGTVRFQTRIR